MFDLVSRFEQAQKEKRARQQRRSSENWRVKMKKKKYSKIELWLSKEDFSYLQSIKGNRNWIVLFHDILKAYRERNGRPR